MLWQYPLEVHVNLLFMLLPQCMLLFPWEGKIYVLIPVWQYFLLSYFLKFCYWFRLNSRDTPCASTKNISVAGMLHSGTFVARSLVNQSCLELQCSLTSGGFFLQLIEKNPNPCNLLYLTEVKYAFWIIYIFVADCHFQPEKWPVVLGFITVLLWPS